MAQLYHIVEAQQFDRELLSNIFAVSQEMEQIVQHYGSSLSSLNCHRLLRSASADANQHHVVQFQLPLDCARTFRLPSGSANADSTTTDVRSDT